MTRVDLAGATLDIWPLYLFHDNVVTVNFAVNRYTRCDIVTHADPSIVLRSKDLGKEERFDSLAALCAAKSFVTSSKAVPSPAHGSTAKNGSAAIKSWLRFLASSTGNGK